MPDRPLPAPSNHLNASDEFKSDYYEWFTSYTLFLIITFSNGCGVDGGRTGHHDSVLSLYSPCKARIWHPSLTDVSNFLWTDGSEKTSVEAYLLSAFVRGSRTEEK